MKTLIVILVLISNGSSEDELTPSAVYQYCVEQGVLHPEIVTAQSIWETGWYECEGCSLDENNIFGFTTGGPYISFDDWKACVRYYKRWQDRHYDPERDYYEFLECMYEVDGKCTRYAKDPDYKSKLKGTVRRHAHSWKKK